MSDVTRYCQSRDLESGHHQHEVLSDNDCYVLASAYDALASQLAEAQAELTTEKTVSSALGKRCSALEKDREYNAKLTDEFKQQLAVATADNAALLIDLPHASDCSGRVENWRIGGLQECDCLQSQPHPGTALLDELARLRERVKELEQGWTGLETATMLARVNKERCEQLEQRLAAMTEFHAWVLTHSHCQSSAFGNQPCDLNEQPDTWCFYHKALAAKALLDGDKDKC